MLQEVLDKLHLQGPKELTVTTDSRNCPQGSVFVGIKGDRFDGNQFVQQALINGASLVISDNEDAVRCITPDRYILVSNTLLALQELARQWREYLGLPIIGITGTNGKTTTKELTAAVLSKKYNLCFTQGNLNNQIGVPLTVLSINKSHKMAIVEMGASHIGDIKELVDIAEPQYGLITNIGKAHLQGFGSLEGVRQTKGELYDFLREHEGKVFVNGADAMLSDMAKDLTTIPYTKGEVIDCNPTLTMSIEGKTVQTNLIGAYNADNVRAAITIGRYFDIPLESCIEAIEHYVPSNNRSMLKITERNSIIVDAYNANATSMAAAIGSMAHSGTDNAVLILGDMLELGDYAPTEHQSLVDSIEKYGFKQVYLVGSNFCNTQTSFQTFADTAQLEAYLTANPLTNKRILLKGSRGMKLETLIPLL